jgi:hypothetical protein
MAMPKEKSQPEWSDEKKSFREAFIKARSEFDKVKKTAPGHFGNYADYEAIYSAVEPALSKYGFTIHQPMKLTPNGVALTTKLSHVDGYEEISEMLLPLREELFDIGSSITYLRRYQLVTLLGLPLEDQSPAPAPDPEHKTETSSFTAPGGEFRFKFGKFGGKTFAEADKMGKGGEVAGYVNWLMSQDPVKNKPIQTAFFAWEKSHAASKGHKDFDEPPPPTDFDHHF